MATVTPLPFVVALLVALAAFAVWMWFLVKESRRPYHWPEPRWSSSRRPHGRTCASSTRSRSRSRPTRSAAPGSRCWSRRSCCGHSGRPAAPIRVATERITDARRRYDSTRSACECTIVVTISSSTPVRSTSCLELAAHGDRVADHVRRGPLLHLLALERCEPVLGRLLRRRVDVGPTRAQAEEGERHRARRASGRARRSHRTPPTPRASGTAARARATAGTRGGRPRARRRASPARSGTRTSTACRGRPPPCAP